MADAFLGQISGLTPSLTSLPPGSTRQYNLINFATPATKEVKQAMVEPLGPANKTPVPVSSGNSQKDKKPAPIRRFGNRPLTGRGVGEEVGSNSMQCVRAVAANPLLPNQIPAAHSAQDICGTSANLGVWVAHGRTKGGDHGGGNIGRILKLKLRQA